jgi:hypothetical protein
MRDFDVCTHRRVLRALHGKRASLACGSARHGPVDLEIGQNWPTPRQQGAALDAAMRIDRGMDVLATRATASDPKAGANYKLPQLDVVQSVIAASPWTPVIEQLSAAQWYTELNEGLLLSALGLAHELYGSGIKHDTTPINLRVAAPLIMVAVR